MGEPAPFAHDEKTALRQHTDRRGVVARKDEPGLGAAAPPVGDRIREVGWSVARCRDRRDDRVPQLNGVTVGKGHVLEVDAGSGGQYGVAPVLSTSNGSPETWSAWTCVSNTARIGDPIAAAAAT
jgi:hypothetical protein